MWHKVAVFSGFLRSVAICLFPQRNHFVYRHTRMAHTTRFSRFLAIGVVVAGLALAGCTSTVTLIYQGPHDGPGAPFGYGLPTGQSVAALTFGGVAHAFYGDATGNLVHVWRSGSSWAFERLDGPNSTKTGRIADQVNNHISAVLYQGLPHVFYQDVTNGRLRHSFFTGTSWRAEYLDVATNVGSFTSAVATPNRGNQLNVFYRDEGNKRLRHAWWNGTSWSFESLDGPGVAGGNGRKANFTGQYTAAFAIGGSDPHVMYYDEVGGDLRQAYYGGAPAMWRFETVDGAAPATPGGSPTGSLTGYDSDVGRYVSTGTAEAGGTGIFYHDAYNDGTGGNGALRRLYVPASGSQFNGPAQIDGPPFLGTANVGGYPASAYALDQNHVFYYQFIGADGQNKWAMQTGAGAFAVKGVIDGDSYANGHSGGDVGVGNAISVVDTDPGKQAKIYHFTWDKTNGVLRLHVFQVDGPPSLLDLLL